jgi:hypothetical protein
MAKISRNRVLAIMIALLFLGVKFVTWGDDSSSLWSSLLMIFSLSLGVIGLGAAFFPFFVLILLLKFYFSETGHEYEYSFSTPVESLPAKHYQLENELKDYGFSLLGNYDGRHQTEANQSYRSWVYLDESKSISAALIQHTDGNYSVEFNSRYTDKFTLATFYNMELEADSALVMVRYFMNSLENAFAFHSTHKDMLSAKHGKPIIYTKLEDTIESPEYKLELHRSLGRVVMMKYALNGLRYLSYPLLGILAYVLTPLLGANLVAWVFFPCAALLSWFVDPLNSMNAFQSVEERKSRKSAE